MTRPLATTSFPNTATRLAQVMTVNEQETAASPRADGGVVVQQQEQETEQTPLYERAKGVSMDNLMPTWLPQRFAEELIDETDLHWDLDDFRLAEVHNRHSEDGLELLLVAEDATRLFIGEDSTARDSNGLFGYIIEADDRLPLVRTTQEALDLLKPAQAAAAEMDDATPIRQGEWFLVPTDDEPVSEVFSGEVSERPFGGSPLENHVPTEYALGVTGEDFINAFEEQYPQREGYFETPGEVFKWAWKQHALDLEDVEIPDWAPTADELRELAEPVYVRGTLRHRENDHYMERIGDRWHLAVTHDVDVFTIETSELQDDNPVRLD